MMDILLFQALELGKYNLWPRGRDIGYVALIVRNENNVTIKFAEPHTSFFGSHRYKEKLILPTRSLSLADYVIIDDEYSSISGNISTGKNHILSILGPSDISEELMPWTAFYRIKALFETSTSLAFINTVIISHVEKASQIDVKDIEERIASFFQGYKSHGSRKSPDFWGIIGHIKSQGLKLDYGDAVQISEIGKETGENLSLDETKRLIVIADIRKYK